MMSKKGKLRIGGRRRDERGKKRVRFAIHFIRPDIDAGTSYKKEGASHSKVNHRLEFRRMMERKSLALHKFLNAPNEYSKLVVAIDVANTERNSEPHQFKPYFDLLRGDLEARECLVSTMNANEGFVSWQAELSRNIPVHKLKAKPLRCYYHAGEDCNHPMTGIRHIWELINLFGMKSDDRIGHGLALWIGCSIQPDQLATISDESGYGECLDNLVWLHRMIAERGVDRGELDHLASVESVCASLANKIYREDLPLYTLYDLQDRRYEFRDLVNARPNANDRVANLLQREWTDSMVIERRLAAVPRHDQAYRLYRKSAGALRGVSKILLEDVRKAGITIEVCPSSNLTVMSKSDPRDHPYCRLAAKVSSIPKVLLSTDDPGMFNVRIENETVLMALSAERPGGAPVKLLESFDHIKN